MRQRNIDKQLETFDRVTAGREPFTAGDFRAIMDRAGGDPFEVISVALRYGYAVGHSRKQREQKNGPSD